MKNSEPDFSILLLRDLLGYATQDTGETAPPIIRPVLVWHQRRWVFAVYDDVRSALGGHQLPNEARVATWRIDYFEHVLPIRWWIDIQRLVPPEEW